VARGGRKPLDNQQFYTLSYLAIFTAVGLLFAIIPLLLAAMITPFRPGQTKNDTYECGLETRGDTWIQFRVQYYIIALAFLVFDLEAVFILPAAVVLRSHFVEQGMTFGLLAMGEILLFIVILTIGLIYAWSKRLLQWN
jgi:NADH-quinone oxidoreductase subunit A